MAIIHYEHFDLYGTDLTNLAARGQTVTGGSLVTDARTGTHCYQNQSSGVVGVRYALSSPLTTVGHGCAINYASNISDFWLFNAPGLRFGTPGNANQVKIQNNQFGGINVYVGFGLAGSSEPGILSPGSWAWLEARATSGSGNGSIVVRLNGATVLTLDNLNLTEQWTSVAIGQEDTVTPLTRFDDWVVWDTSGTINNNFVGDTFVIVASPNADALPGDWIPNSGSDRFSRVNETTPDDDTFITANNVGDAQEFSHVAPNLPIGAIAAIATQVRVFKTDSGASSVEVGLSSNSATSMSGENALATGALVRSHIANLNPDGNQPWTQNAAQSARLRIRRIS